MLEDMALLDDDLLDAGIAVPRIFASFLSGNVLGRS